MAVHIYYIGLALCVIFFWIGVYTKDVTFVGVSGLIFLLFGLEIFIYGFDGVENLLSQGLSLLVISLGAYMVGKTAEVYFDS